MGYSGTSPLGKHQGGIVKPIHLQTKSTNDKVGLRYNPRKSSDQKHTSHHKPKWTKRYYLQHHRKSILGKLEKSMKMNKKNRQSREKKQLVCKFQLYQQ